MTIDFLKYGVVSDRQKINDFYVTQIAPENAMPIHHRSNPEISLLDEGNATGTWQYEA